MKKFTVTFNNPKQIKKMFKVLIKPHKYSFRNPLGMIFDGTDIMVSDMHSMVIDHEGCETEQPFMLDYNGSKFISENVNEMKNCYVEGIHFYYEIDGNKGKLNLCLEQTQQWIDNNPNAKKAERDELKVIVEYKRYLTDLTSRFETYPLSRMETKRKSLNIIKKHKPVIKKAKSVTKRNLEAVIENHKTELKTEIETGTEKSVKLLKRKHREEIQSAKEKTTLTPTDNENRITGGVILQDGFHYTPRNQPVDEYMVNDKIVNLRKVMPLLRMMTGKTVTITHNPYDSHSAVFFKSESENMFFVLMPLQLKNWN